MTSLRMQLIFSFVTNYSNSYPFLCQGGVEGDNFYFHLMKNRYNFFRYEPLKSLLSIDFFIMNLVKFETKQEN